MKTRRGHSKALSKAFFKQSSRFHQPKIRRVAHCLEGKPLPERQLRDRAVRPTQGTASSNDTTDAGDPEYVRKGPSFIVQNKTRKTRVRRPNRKYHNEEFHMGDPCASVDDLDGSKSLTSADKSDTLDDADSSPNFPTHANTRHSIRGGYVNGEFFCKEADVNDLQQDCHQEWTYAPCTPLTTDRRTHSNIFFWRSKKLCKRSRRRPASPSLLGALEKWIHKVQGPSLCPHSSCEEEEETSAKYRDCTGQFYCAHRSDCSCPAPSGFSAIYRGQALCDGKILESEEYGFKSDQEELLVGEDVVQSVSGLVQGPIPSPESMPRRHGFGDAAIIPLTPAKGQTRQRTSSSHQAVQELLAKEKDVCSSNGMEILPLEFGPVPLLANGPENSTGGLPLPPKSGPLACINAGKEISIYVDLSMYSSCNSDSVIVSTPVAPQSVGFDTEPTSSVGSMGASEELALVVGSYISNTSNILEESYLPSRLAPETSGQLQAKLAMETSSEPVAEVESSALNPVAVPAGASERDLGTCLANSCSDMDTSFFRVDRGTDKKKQADVFTRPGSGVLPSRPAMADLHHIESIVSATVKKKKYTPKVFKEKKPLISPQKGKERSGKSKKRKTCKDGEGVGHTSCKGGSKGVAPALDDGTAVGLTRKSRRKKRRNAEQGDLIILGDRIELDTGVGLDETADRIGSITPSALLLVSTTAIVKRKRTRQKHKTAEGEDLTKLAGQPGPHTHNTAICKSAACKRSRHTAQSCKINFGSTLSTAIENENLDKELGNSKAIIGGLYFSKQPGAVLSTRSDLQHSNAEVLLGGKSHMVVPLDGAVTPAANPLMEQWTVHSNSSVKLIRDRPVSVEISVAEQSNATDDLMLGQPVVKVGLSIDQVITLERDGVCNIGGESLWGPSNMESPSAKRNTLRRSLMKDFNTVATSEQFLWNQSLGGSECDILERSGSLVDVNVGVFPHNRFSCYYDQGCTQSNSSMEGFEEQKTTMARNSQRPDSPSRLFDQPIPFLRMNASQRILYMKSLMAYPGCALSPVVLWRHIMKYVQAETERKLIVGLWPHVMENIPETGRAQVVADLPDVKKYLPVTDKEQVMQEQNSANVLFEGLQIVPYEGRAGDLVPYEGPIHSLRKRKLRIQPKVVLDAETVRVWKLLKEKSDDIGSETDGDKKIKWEEERRVMEVRATDFISRMHLVQGDRSFSEWKGSVVDSVVGAFMTQNVSDFLSSSAFMALRSHFPVTRQGVNGSKQASTPVESGEPLEQGYPECRISKCEATSATCLDGCEGRDPNRAITDLEPISDPETVAELSVNMTEVDDPDINCSVEDSLEERFGEALLLPATSQEGSNMLEHFTMSSDPLDTSPHVSPDMNTQVGAGVAQAPAVDCSEKEDKVGGPGKHHDTVQCLGGDLFNPEQLHGNDFLNDEYGHLLEQALAGTVHTILGRSTISMQNSSQERSAVKVNRPLNLQAVQRRRGQSANVSEVYVPRRRTVEKGRRPKGNFNKKGLSGPQRARFEEKEPVDLKDWEAWRIERTGTNQQDHEHARSFSAEDAVDWEAVRLLDVPQLAEIIKERGMYNILADRILGFLDRLHNDHGKIDLEWLRSLSVDDSKEFLSNIYGLGPKSVDCIRLLTLHHPSFPVDTNVGRIFVRLGWVPLQPLPEEVQLHILDKYPVQASIQQYLWPRLCTLDKEILYELHYQMITFGKVFCTKSRPNCNACPMRSDCKHYASAYARWGDGACHSAKPLLTAPDKAAGPILALPSAAHPGHSVGPEAGQDVFFGSVKTTAAVSPRYCLPIIEEPSTSDESDTESDIGMVDKPTAAEIKDDPMLSISKQGTHNRHNMEFGISNSCPPNPANVVFESELRVLETVGVHCMPSNAPSNDQPPNDGVDAMDSLGDIEDALDCADISQPSGALIVDIPSQALVLLPPEAAFKPVPKLKNIGRLQTVHYVYELPDGHPLLNEMDAREADDPCCYLLAIWSPGEVPESTPDLNDCDIDNPFALSGPDGDAETVKGTLLVPCRTAMQGKFPLNGTYFQVNEVFADHASSLQPIGVPRRYLWNLRRRFVYFGTSVTSIFRGMTTEEIQACFWRGYICVRGFDGKTRAPKPLAAYLHQQTSKSPSKPRSKDSPYRPKGPPQQTDAIST